MSSLSTPVTFSGSSTFSSSFQQVLQRAVSIASLPMMQMQANVNKIQSQQYALAGLQATFGSLQNSIQSIASATKGNVTATSSNSTIAVAAAQASTLPGTYSLEVDSIGSSTTTISAPGTTPVTSPSTASISSSLSYKLFVNGNEHDFTLATNSLQNLATAINDSGAGVQATVVNLGSNSSPDYRLSVTSSNLGADTIQLNDGTTDLLSTLQSGAPAEYKVNGNSTVLTSNSTQVTLAPGLTATMLSASPNTIVNITVAANQNALSTALSGFVDAYNSAVDAVGQHRGQHGGALAGESVVFSLSQTLSQMSQFNGDGGTVQTLTGLGLTLDSTGHLSFNSSTFNGLKASDIQKFLGGVTSGGFLQTANDAVESVANSTNGVLMTQVNSVTSEITALNSKMADAQERVTNLQNSLSAQLSAADAAIAVLEQQKTFYKDMFAAQYLTNNGLGR